jgi:hypothetical protein
MSYFEESATLPPPFNIIPAPKNILKILGMRKKDKIRRMSTKVRMLSFSILNREVAAIIEYRRVVI